MTLTISNFEVPSLTELDSVEVNQLLERLSTQLQELNPDLDLKRGVFKDTLAYYHAVLETAIRTNLERYQSARSLQQIEADPSLADAGVVDEVLSNFGVTRKLGTAATGSVTIELSALRTVTISQGFVFEADGRTYTATDTFVARTSASQVSGPTDRLLTTLSDGNFAFTITVEAAEIGAESKLNAGDLIVPNRSIVSYVTSYATSTFEDGTNTETNQELINELQVGVAAEALSNRVNMKAWLRSLEDYPAVTNQSVVGYGDAEMLRDQHTVFPISYGGRVDWYIRTQAPLQRLSTTATATCIAVGVSSSTWQFSVTKDVSPGFYEIDTIRLVTDSGLNTGFAILSDTRGNDLTGLGFIPDIETVAEGAYTAFQTTTVTFEDTVSNVSGLVVGDTQDYAYDLLGMPDIAKLQALVASRDIRSYAADALVKSPVPCITDITFTVNKAEGDAAIDVDGIKSAVLNEVNSVSFIGRLDGSRIIEVISACIQDDISVTNLDLFGRILVPGGGVQYIRDADSLVVPDDPANMVTSNTVQFFTELSRISVNVQTVIPTAI